MTGAEVKRLVSMLVATWPRPEVRPETVGVYCAALADLDAKAAHAAVMDLVRTSRFFPTVAEIRERVVRDRVPLPSPEEAWGIVRRAIGRVGAYAVPEFDCDEVAAAVDAIGWSELCLGENPVANRARWIDAYRSVCERRRTDEALGRPRSSRVLGVGERVPVATGYPTARPTALESPAGGVVLALADKLARRGP